MRQANSHFAQTAIEKMSTKQTGPASDMSPPNCESFHSAPALSVCAAKVRQAATMIGVAISMGTVGLVGTSTEQAFAAGSESYEASRPTSQAFREYASSAPKVAVVISKAASQASSVEQSAQLSAPSVMHHVKPGESLEQIAAQYQIAPEAISSVNGLSLQANLLSGQIIEIPSAKVQGGSQRLAQTIDRVAQSYAVDEATSVASRIENTLVVIAQPSPQASTVDPVEAVLEQQDNLKTAQQNRQSLQQGVSSVAEVASTDARSETSLSNADPSVERLLLAEAATTQEEQLLEPSLKEGVKDINGESPFSENASTLPGTPEVAANFTAPISIPVPPPEQPGFSKPVEKKEEVSSFGNIHDAEVTERVVNPVEPSRASFAASPQPSALESSNTPISTESPAIRPSLDDGEENAARAQSPELGSSQAPIAISAAEPESATQAFDQPIDIPVPAPETAKNPVQQPAAPEVIANPESTVAVADSVPVARVFSSGQASRQTHQVRRGETLNAIAQRYGVPKTDIIRTNGIRNPNLISVNQELVIPNAVSSSNGTERIVAASSNLPAVSIDGTPLQKGASKVNEAALNPEWEQTRRQARAELAKQTEQPTSPELPQLNAATEVDSDDASTSPQTQLISAAPSDSQKYNRMLRSPIGEVVSPELPSLDSPNQYLPDTPSKFNGFIWPAKGVLTSGYGWRWGRMHKGIDIAAPIGTPIVAAAPGEVISSGWNSGGYGNLVKLRHPDGSMTLYAHNSRLLVRTGQKVEQGEKIALMGSTGFSTGPHLHFELHPKGQAAVNPIALLQKK